MKSIKNTVALFSPSSVPVPYKFALLSVPVQDEFNKASPLGKQKGI